MNMRIIMYMNIYITPQNEMYLKKTKADGESMSGLVNRLLNEHFAEQDGFNDKNSKNTPPIKIQDVQNFVTRGQAAQVAVNDLIKKSEPVGSTPVTPDTFASMTKTAGEQVCCGNETKPCKHWVWDVATGEGYVNSLSGRVMEVE